MFAQYIDGVITSVFANPQPDAVDAEGKVICKGVETVELADDHPDVLAYLAPKAEVAQPTIDDIIAVLSPQQQSELSAKVK